MKKAVYIIGSKGIPAKYGGFETFVEKLTACPAKSAYPVLCRLYAGKFSKVRHCRGCI